LADIRAKVTFADWRQFTRVTSVQSISQFLNC
jgi:hypothetical protein